MSRDQLIVLRFEEVKLRRELRKAKINIAFWFVWIAAYFASVVWLAAELILYDSVNGFSVLSVTLLWAFWVLIHQYKAKGVLGFQLSTKTRSLLGIHLFYYSAWPTRKNGTNFWCLEIRGLTCWPVAEIKLDFWNPRDDAGFIRVVNPDGSETVTYDPDLCELLKPKKS